MEILNIYIIGFMVTVIALAILEWLDYKKDKAPPASPYYLLITGLLWFVFWPYAMYKILKGYQNKG